MVLHKNRPKNKNPWISYLLHPYFLFLSILIIFGVLLSWINAKYLPGNFPITTIFNPTSPFWSSFVQLPLTNYAYFIFLLLAVCCYYLIPAKWRWIPISVFNIIFILGFGLAVFIPLVITSIISFSSALLISKQQDQSKKKLIMRIANLLCILLLLSYKYTLPTTWLFYKAFGTSVIRLLLPAGISFYVFQAIAYITDVYSGKRPVSENFGLYFASLSFFPKFTSGPIERQPGYIEQFIQPRKLNPKALQTGIVRIAWGVFKKMVLTNRLSPVLQPLFTSPDTLSWSETLIGIIFYSLFIYIDFSAYCDIAIGSAELFGIQLTENFNHPYFAESIQEFWQRWHISLSSWLNDYIFAPLNFSSRRIQHKVVTFINLFIVFLVSGMWHGTTIPFILWGLLLGVYQMIGILIRPVREKLRTVFGINKESLLSTSFRIGTTFILVTLTWVFFGANSFGTIKTIFVNLFSISQNAFEFSLSSLSLTKIDFNVILISLGVLIIVEIISRKVNLFNLFIEMPYPIKASLFVIFCLAILLLGDYQVSIVNNFVYDLF